MINLIRLLYTQKPRPTLHPPYRELDVAHANRRWHNECFKQEMAAAWPGVSFIYSLTPHIGRAACAPMAIALLPPSCTRTA